MQNVMQAIQPKPFQYEALAYAERCGIDSPGDLERVRLSMVRREFMERMEPWHTMLARHLAYFTLTPGEEMPESFLHMKAEVEKIARHEAESLGVTLYTSP